MSRRRPVRGQRRALAPCDLVLAAAEVTGLDPDEVLDHADVEVLVAIAARAREAISAVDAASEVLVGLAASRPFARANGAAGWLAAMQLLDDHQLDVSIDDSVATGLVREAASGRATEAQVAVRLAAVVSHRPGRWRRVGRRVANAAASPRSTASSPTTYECPVCHRIVGDARWPMTNSIPAAAFEVVAVCARQHGVHDLRGRARSLPSRPSLASRWCPLVFGPRHDTGTPFVAITDDGPIAFRPSKDGAVGADGGSDADEGIELEVVVLEGLAPSDLIGSWEQLWSRGDVIGRVPADACVFDESGSLLDWQRLIEDEAVPDSLIPELSLTA